MPYAGLFDKPSSAHISNMTLLDESPPLYLNTIKYSPPSSSSYCSPPLKVSSFNGLGGAPAVVNVDTSNASEVASGEPLGFAFSGDTPSDAYKYA